MEDFFGIGKGQYALSEVGWEAGILEDFIGRNMEDASDKEKSKK